MQTFFIVCYLELQVELFLRFCLVIIIGENGITSNKWLSHLYIFLKTLILLSLHKTNYDNCMFGKINCVLSLKIQCDCRRCNTDMIRT